MKAGRWVVLGLLLLPLWLVIKAPAALVANLAAQGGLQLTGVTGSAWSGQAKSARLQLPPAAGKALVFDLGTVHWQLEPLSLLTLKACARLESQLLAQQLRARLCQSPTGLQLSEARLNVPASYLGLLGQVQASGQVMLAIDRLRLTGNRVTELQGAGRLENFSLLLGRDWQSLGSLNLSLGQQADQFSLALESDDRAIGWTATAPDIKLGLAGPELYLSSRLTLSESYRLQWQEALTLLGFEAAEGGFLFELKLP